MSRHPAVVALVGNPNAGKSALFNALTGARQKIANYPGVTVERKAGRMLMPNGEPVELVDLPGTYGLDTTSPDEEVTRRVIMGEQPGQARPEVLVIVLDASNLEQHLVLAQEVIALGRPTVVALNMIDLAQRDGLVLLKRHHQPVGPHPAHHGVANPGHLLECRAGLAQVHREEVARQVRHRVGAHRGHAVALQVTFQAHVAELELRPAGGPR